MKPNLQQSEDPRSPLLSSTSHLRFGEPKQGLVWTLTDMGKNIIEDGFPESTVPIQFSKISNKLGMKPVRHYPQYGADSVS